MEWIDQSKVQPPRAGYYLVANAELQKTSMARYMPRKDEWKHPNANMAFTVTWWADMPEPPK